MRSLACILTLLLPLVAEATQKVGEASFKMLNDPNAGEKNYVPDLDEVLEIFPVINPGAEHVHHFRAPTKPGDYPYI